MEPLQKRRKLPEHGNADADLRRKRAQNDQRLKSIFESIFEKYERDFDGIGDEINLETGNIEVDNGHIFGMRHEKDPGNADEDSTSISAAGDDSSADERSDDTEGFSDDDLEDVLGRSVADGIGASWPEKEVAIDVETQSDAFDPSSVKRGQVVDEYHDELAIGGYESPAPRMKTTTIKSPWQLPDGLHVGEHLTRGDSTWSTPSYHRNFALPKERPFHRRLAHPSLGKLDIRGIEAQGFTQKSSIWAVAPIRHQRSRISKSEGMRELVPGSHHLDPSRLAGTWSTREQDELVYMRTQTKLTYHEMTKYFPGRTEQSLEDCWDELKNRDNIQAVLDHHSQSTLSDYDPLRAFACRLEAGASLVSERGPSRHSLSDGRQSPPTQKQLFTPDLRPPKDCRDMRTPPSSHTRIGQTTTQERKKHPQPQGGQVLLKPCQVASESASSPRLPTRTGCKRLQVDGVSREIPDSDTLMDSSSSTTHDNEALASSNNRFDSDKLTMLDTRDDLDELSLNESASTKATSPKVFNSVQIATKRDGRHSLYKNSIVATSPSAQLPMATNIRSPTRTPCKVTSISTVKVRGLRSSPGQGREFGTVSPSRQRQVLNRSFSHGNCPSAARDKIRVDTPCGGNEWDLSLEAEGLFETQMTELGTGNARATSQEIPDSQSLQTIMGISRRNAQLAKRGSSQQDAISIDEPHLPSAQSRSDREKSNQANILPSYKRLSSRRKSAWASPSNGQASIITNSPANKKARSIKETHSPSGIKLARRASKISLSELCDGSDDDLSICLANALPVRTPKRLMQKQNTRHTSSSSMDHDSPSVCFAGSKANNGLGRTVPKPKIGMQLPLHMSDCSDDELA